MARKNGYYKVRHHNVEKVMQWTTTNDDNTEDLSGYWSGSGAYIGHDHDMDFINETLLSDKIILNLIDKGFSTK